MCIKSRMSWLIVWHKRDVDKIGWFVYLSKRWWSSAGRLARSRPHGQAHRSSKRLIWFRCTSGHTSTWPGVSCTLRCSGVSLTCLNNHLGPPLFCVCQCGCPGRQAVLCCRFPYDLWGRWQKVILSLVQLLAWRC